MDTNQLQLSNDNWETSRVVIAIVVGLSTVSVGLRIWTNYVQRRRARAGERPFRFPPQSDQDFRLVTLTDNILIAASVVTVVISAMNIFLDSKKYPAKPADTEDTIVGKMNLATHSGWLTTMWLNSASVLLNYDATFHDVIDRKDKKIGPFMMRALHISLFIWWLSSLLFVGFQDGIHFDEYWTIGPNTAYIFRIWYTNISHIVLTVIIVLLPIRWIWLARTKRSRVLVYLLLLGALSIIVVLSGKRLWILDRRFAASKGDRYVLSIEAVMYSIIEANVAIICTNLPALGYRFCFDWVEANEARRPRGRERRDTTVGGHEIELQTVNQVEDLER